MLKNYTPEKEILAEIASGSVWRDFAKYYFVRNKVFNEKNSLFPIKISQYKGKYIIYENILQRVYNFWGDFCAFNCKLQIARNFFKYGIEQQTICKIFGFSDTDFELVRPISND